MNIKCEMAKATSPCMTPRVRVSHACVMARLPHRAWLRGSRWVMYVRWRGYLTVHDSVGPGESCMWDGQGYLTVHDFAGPGESCMWDGQGYLTVHDSVGPGESCMWDGEATSPCMTPRVPVSHVCEMAKLPHRAWLCGSRWVMYVRWPSYLTVHDSVGPGESCMWDGLATSPCMTLRVPVSHVCEMARLPHRAWLCGSRWVMYVRWPCYLTVHDSAGPGESCMWDGLATSPCMTLRVPMSHVCEMAMLPHRAWLRGSRWVMYVRWPGYLTVHDSAVPGESCMWDGQATSPCMTPRIPVSHVQWDGQATSPCMTPRLPVSHVCEMARLPHRAWLCGSRWVMYVRWPCYLTVHDSAVPGESCTVR